MMDIVGYAKLSQDADGITAGPIDQYRGRIVRVLEFTPDGDILAIGSDGGSIGSFDARFVKHSFRCCVVDHVVCPPFSNPLSSAHYSMRAKMRTGGYDETVFKMVIAASLAKGRFTDGFLWHVNPQESPHQECNLLEESFASMKTKD